MNFLSKNKKLCLTALYVALGVLVPFAAGHAFGVPGTVLLPMHIPVFLAGVTVGWWSGLAVGILSPLLSSLITGMPTMFPMMIIMMVELPLYGLVAGFLHKRLKINIYLSLPPAMIIGRFGYFIMFTILNAATAEPLRALSVVYAFFTGAPGIIIQLIVIPPLGFAIANNFRLPIASIKKRKLIKQAKVKIKAGEYNLAVIKRGRIEKTGSDIGVKALYNIYKTNPEILKNAVVVDKVVGKAAAVICVESGVKEVHAGVCSRAAFALLKDNLLLVKHEKLVDVIKNRTRDGICPLELRLAEISDTSEAVLGIEGFMAEMIINHTKTP